MKKLALGVFVLLGLTSFNLKQTHNELNLIADTIIKNNVYTSYYSFNVRNPLYVTYKLYKGGGDCNRSKYSFKNEKDKHFSTKQDYITNEFDEGHLVNAEDFAYDCSKMELTFKFYNCLPQYPNLNRGIWKSYENKICKLSQTDSLLIICGGIYIDDTRIEKSQTLIPKYCFKIVKSLSTNEVIYSLLFTNEKEKNSIKSIPIGDLKRKLKYDLKLN